jgi:di/tricarboxylate transporter
MLLLQFASSLAANLAAISAIAPVAVDLRKELGTIKSILGMVVFRRCELGYRAIGSMP